MEPVPTVLDWVKARAECSIEHLFLLLAEVIDTDVKSMQAYVKKDVKVTVSRPTESKVIVTKSQDWGGGFGRNDAVVFERTSAGIAARTQKDQQLFVAKPSLAINGRCRLEIDGQPLELWQVSRRALEALFFE